METPKETPVKTKKEFPWLRRFWDEHGDRFVFAGIACGIGLALIYFLGKPEEGTTIIVGTAMIFFNKIRSPKNGNPPKG